MRAAPKGYVPSAAGRVSDNAEQIGKSRRCHDSLLFAERAVRERHRARCSPEQVKAEQLRLVSERATRGCFILTVVVVVVGVT